MAIAANFRKYAEAMALQLVLPFGKPVWNGSRPTTKLGRAIRAYITKAMKARGLIEYPEAPAIPQWWKDAQTRARAFAEFIKDACTQFDFSGEKTVAVLFARADSIYKKLTNTDVWDIVRDARRWQGGAPVVAHPPCRAWGRLRSFAKPRKGERQLAIWSIRQVRKFGGVLEHPAGSTLWKKAGLPLPGQRDKYGGWTLAAPQYWWGHKAEKATWFYIVGCEPGEIPEVPIKLGEPTHVVQSRKKDSRPHISKSEREHTPPELAAWLCELARRCQLN